MRVLTCCALLGALACQSRSADPAADLGPISVVSIQEPNARLPASGTFALDPGSEVRGDPARAHQIEGILVDLLSAGLMERGLRPTFPANADVLLAYVLGFERDLGEVELLQRFGFSSNWAPPGADPGRLEKGTLVLLLADGRSRSLLWRASAQGLGVVDLTPEQRRERLAPAVDRLLERLPPFE